MSELTIHKIKEIRIKHGFCESNSAEESEFSTIKIFVEGYDPDVKKFKITLFLNPDTEFKIENLLLAYQRGMEVKKPKPPDPEDQDPLDEEIVDPFPDEEKDEENVGSK